jgi:hypothetical protein
VEQYIVPAVLPEVRDEGKPGQCERMLIYRLTHMRHESYCSAVNYNSISFAAVFIFYLFVKKAAAVAVKKGVALRDDEPYSIS